MPRGRTRASARRPGRSFALTLVAVIAVALALLVGYMFVHARTVHIRFATVTLEDLPAEFDGTKILFVSDVDLFGANSAASVDRLFDRLAALQPDLLLLGGDYASPSLVERLNAADGPVSGATERMVDDRSALLQTLAGFPAPLGKYAVMGEADVLPESLRLAMQSAGVSLLEDEAALITRGDARIGVVGLGDTGGEVPNLISFAERIESDECVIVLAHNPVAFVGVQTAEAKGGGAWADMMLCGHTHGGQIVLGGRTVFQLSEYEQRYMSGWRREGGVAQLTSNGLGCTGANLRLGTEAEVHLITLKRGTPEDDLPTGSLQLTDPESGAAAPADPAATFSPPNSDARWDLSG